MSFIIRTSDRTKFKSCRQEWDWSSKIRQNYEPLAPPRALSFGTAIHAGLEAYYTPNTWNDVELKQALAQGAFIKELESQKQGIITIRGELSIDVDIEFQEQRELGIGMLQHYFLWSPEQDATYIPVKTEIEFEVPIRVPRTVDVPLGFAARNDELYLQDEPVMYQGRVDLILQNIRTEKYAIVDHKTAAMFGRTEWLQLDDQCTSYGWALNFMLGIDVDRIFYNQLRKKAPHPPSVLKSGNLSVNKQQDTTAELFIKTCLDKGYNPAAYQDYIDFLKENPKEFCRRIVMTRTQQEYKSQARRICLEAIDMLSNPRIYPSPNFMSCALCSFFRPCVEMQGGGDVQWILDTIFHRRTSAN